ncbi:DEAD-box ATP-dependent RNA helicase 53-like isoform X2 [Olea europaea subsp. europaea]|uniref:RNA helicase n=1 Tax=Olea europaea subsp. europaea TaxID=158383 RepID=A0A8S0RC12_OLEEU|nr:DEAD-box ATP-dependent RNA helicase 53-like isoform X2 [Olea europaea subsp. europaea]
MDPLKQGVDVVAGTPGRVIDLIKRGSLSLLEVQFVVLDEADQMFNVGFMDDVETIQGYMLQKHKTIMILATMLNSIIKLTQKFFKNPVNVDLAGDFIQISLFAISSEMREKPAIIGTLITEHAKIQSGWSTQLELYGIPGLIEKIVANKACAHFALPA